MELQKLKNLTKAYLMKNTIKKISCMVLATAMMASTLSMSASAYVTYYQDSSRLILSSTMLGEDDVTACGNITNLSTVKTTYSVRTTLYYKTSARKVGSYSGSNWKTSKLAKDKSIKVYDKHSRNYDNLYSARTQVMKGNSIYKTLQSMYG